MTFQLPVTGKEKMKNRKYLVLVSLWIGFVSIACSTLSAPLTSEPTTTPLPPTPTSTPIPGWKKFEAETMEIWLPDSFEGGDPSQDLETLVEKVRILGPEFEKIAQSIEQNPSAFKFWAFDSNVGESGSITNVAIGAEKVMSAMTIKTYLDAVIKQLPDQFHVSEREPVSFDFYQAERIIVEASMVGVTAKQAMYAIKEGNTVWVANFTTSASEFDQKLPIFEQSMNTFRVRS